MRKYAYLVMVMALILAFTSSCGLIVKDEAVDAQTIIVEVAGATITKTEVQQATENVLDYQQYMYSYYGMSYDRTDADHIASAQESAIQSLIEQAVIKQKIQEYGMDQFTDEELATINETVDTTYDSYFSAVQSYYFADTELTGDDLTAAVEAKMQALGYGDKASMLEDEKLSAATDKLKAEVVKDVTVTDDETMSEYASQVSNAISAYASDLTQYASDVSGGSIIYYIPDGYRYVKNLLIMISDDDKTAISTMTTQISDDQDSLDAVTSAIAELPADPAEDTDDQQKSRTELADQSATLTAEIADLTAQLNTLTENAYAAIQPTVDEVEAKIAAGTDFDSLVAQYGQDTGMQSEPTKSQGYLVCEGITTYLDVFTTEAMALQKIGDISDPFRSEYGIHILRYASDLESEQVAYSKIKDQILSNLLTEKQDTLYNDTLSQWITDANAKTYADRMNN
jgi:foldase protein PrsA